MKRWLLVFVLGLLIAPSTCLWTDDLTRTAATVETEQPKKHARSSFSIEYFTYSADNGIQNVPAFEFEDQLSERLSLVTVAEIHLASARSFTLLEERGNLGIGIRFWPVKNMEKIFLGTGLLSSLSLASISRPDLSVDFGCQFVVRSVVFFSPRIGIVYSDHPFVSAGLRAGSFW